MRSVLTQLLAILLVCSQTLFGVAMGRTLCVATGTCEHGEDAEREDRGHCHSHSHHGDEVVRHGEECESHRHGPIGLLDVPHEECGCHVHVPVPNEPQSPPKSSNQADQLQVRIMHAPVVVTVLTWDLWANRRIDSRSRPPDPDAAAQVLALQATRLLV